MAKFSPPDPEYDEYDEDDETVLDKIIRETSTYPFDPWNRPVPRTIKRKAIRKVEPVSIVESEVKLELDKQLVAREVARELVAYDALGDDTYPEDTIVRFVLKQTYVEKEYTFAAVKRGSNNKNHWYLTDGSVYTWDELKRLLVKANPVPVLEVLGPVTAPTEK